MPININVIKNMTARIRQLNRIFHIQHFKTPTDEGYATMWRKELKKTKNEYDHEKFSKWYFKCSTTKVVFSVISFQASWASNFKFITSDGLRERSWGKWNFKFKKENTSILLERWSSLFANYLFTRCSLFLSSLFGLYPVFAIQIEIAATDFILFPLRIMNCFTFGICLGFLNSCLFCSPQQKHLNKFL